MSGQAVQGGSNIFDELYDPEQPSISVTRTSRSDRRIGIVAGDKITALIAQCFPPGGLPGAHPNNTWLRVSSLEIRPHGPTKPSGYTNGVAEWEKYQCEIVYETLPIEEDQQQPGSGIILTRRKSFSAEFLTLPKAALKWDDTGDKLKEDEAVASKLIPMIEHVITQHLVTTVNEKKIRDLVGHVNASTYEGAAGETVLYMGAETTYSFDMSGEKTFTVEHRFLERRIKVGSSIYGWNHIFRPGDGKWAKVKNDDGDYLYEDTDQFPQLFL